MFLWIMCRQRLVQSSVWRNSVHVKREDAVLSASCLDGSLSGGGGGLVVEACTWLAVVGVEVPGFLTDFGHDGAFEEAVDGVDLWNH